MAKKRDIFERIESSLIQHGPLSNRIYLIKMGDFSATSLKNLITALSEKAEANSYSKIFVKVPESAAESFLDAGYTKEAGVPALYSGRESGFFLSKFLSDERRYDKDADLLDDVLKTALSKKPSVGRSVKDNERTFIIRQCTGDDVEAMSKLYKRVFDSYPFPIDDPAYLLKTMSSHIDYFCVESRNAMIALSSAEKYSDYMNAEMTDFATLPESRGKGIATALLKHMEDYLKAGSICTCYTIARAQSYGMNITFAKMGYSYGGRLINNTNIAGKLESMNVWYKHVGAKKE